MLKNRYIEGLFIAGITALIAGCSGTFKSEVNFNPTEPLRIAVLPFAQLDSKGGLIQSDENYLIDDVTIVSSKLKQTPAEFVQSLVQSELSKAALDVIPPAVVEAELVHSGYDAVGVDPVSVDLAKVFAASAKTICQQLLSCDAVLYGKVTHWDRSYYGIQAVATVGVELTLVSAKDDKVLFHATAEDSDRRGLTKGPTGFADLVIEPLKGLDNEIITDLAREVVSTSMQPLYVRNRPAFLTTAPPAILASAHSAINGNIGKDRRLVVVVLGTPGQSGSFTVGSVAQGIPLVEREPGHYIGEFVPLEDDSFHDQFVVASLRDDFGRTISQKLSRTAVSYR